MTEILVLDATDADDEDAIGRVVAENAKDRNEDEWTIEGTDTDGDGRLFVKVTWGSEEEQIFTVEERAGTTEEDRIKLEHILENNDYIYERTDSGRWRIFRGGYE